MNQIDKMYSPLDQSMKSILPGSVSKSSLFPSFPNQGLKKVKNKKGFFINKGNPNKTEHNNLKPVVKNHKFISKRYNS